MHPSFSLFWRNANDCARFQSWFQLLMVLAAAGKKPDETGRPDLDRESLRRRFQPKTRRF
jgi:hypothetical protein